MKEKLVESWGMYIVRDSKNSRYELREVYSARIIEMIILADKLSLESLGEIADYCLALKKFKENRR